MYELTCQFKGKHNQIVMQTYPNAFQALRWYYLIKRLSFTEWVRLKKVSKNT